MTSAPKVSQVVGYKLVVTLIDLDKDISTISFALTKDNKQICFLNTVSPALVLQTCESNNVFIKFPECIS